MKIKIPKPCHENWDQMTSEEQGRFCKVCDKKVIDFSQSSDSSIVDFFSVKRERTCGRFSQDQINRSLYQHPLESVFSKLALGAALTVSTVVSAQEVKTQKKDSTCTVKKDTLTYEPRHTLGVIAVAQPYTVFMINGKYTETTFSRIVELVKSGKMKIKDIKDTYLQPDEAQKKYGKNGINGVHEYIIHTVKKRSLKRPKK